MESVEHTKLLVELSPGSLFQSATSPGLMLASADHDACSDKNQVYNMFLANVSHICYKSCKKMQSRLQMDAKMGTLALVTLLKSCFSLLIL